MLHRLKNDDGGWFWVTSLLIIPAAVTGLFVALVCIHIARQI